MESESGLRRAIRLPHATAMVVGTIIGASIFVQPSEITGQVPEPTIQDVTEWYSQNQSRLRGARLEEVANQIKDMLASEAKAKAWSDFVSPRMEALEWEMTLEPPREELVATRLIRGPAEAPVTIMTSAGMPG